MNHSNVAAALHGSQGSHSLEKLIIKPGTNTNSNQNMRNLRHQSLLLPPITPTSSQTTSHRIPASVEAAASRNGSLVHGYAFQEAVRSGSSGSMVSRYHITRPVEQKTNSRDTLHFQYDRDHPSAVQIPPQSKHPQYSPHPAYHQSPLPSPSTMRNGFDTPISPQNRSSVSNFLSAPQRRQSEPSHSSPIQIEKGSAVSPPAFDPVILAATDTALGPVRVALENAWTLAVNNMRHAMNKMNNDFTRIVSQERQKISFLTSRVTQLENQLQAAQQESKKLELEKLDLHDRHASSQTVILNYKEENKKLRKAKDSLEIEYRVLAGIHKEGRAEETGDREGVSSFDITSVLGAVTEQVSTQVEQKMSTILNEIEEQKALRAQAEQKFAETLLNQPKGKSESVSYMQPSDIQRRSPFSPEILANTPSLKQTSTSSNSLSPMRTEALLTVKRRPPIHDIDHHRSSPDSMPRKVLSSTRNSPLVESPVEVHDDSIPMRADSSLPACHESILRSSTTLPRKRSRPSYEDDEDEDDRRTSKLRYLDDKVNSERSSMSLHVDIQNTELPSLFAVELKPGSIKDEGEEGELSKPLRPSSAPQAARISSKLRTNSFSSRPSTQGAGPPTQRHSRQLGISHIDLLYLTDNGVMTCRMCLREAPAAQDQAKVIITKFQVKNVSWHELIGHCRTEHPKTCQELEKLGPSQIAEMKQRVMSGDRSIPRG